MAEFEQINVSWVVTLLLNSEHIQHNQPIIALLTLNKLLVIEIYSSIWHKKRVD